MDDDAYGKPKSSNFKKRSRNQYDNQKQKRHNPDPSHHLNSGAPKVIETLYRILCPVKKIGSVLGKGGDIVNALRNETHAKIRVADAIPGVEERVIIIFNHPSKQSENSDGDQNLYDDDFTENKFDDMKPHCPAQDALLKVHDRIAADEYLRGGVIHEKAEPDEAVTARILVPNNQVGCLLGKGGTVIQKLRSDYAGANIRVLSAEHIPPCAMSTDELVQISGTPSIVKKALYDISTRLHQHPRKDNPPIDDLIYASTQGLFQPDASMPLPPHGNPMWSHQQRDTYGSPPPPWFGGYRNEPSGYARSSYSSSRISNDEETPEEFSMRILCPTGKIGGVIGKAGANVRQLEHETQSRIQVEDSTQEAKERIVNVSSRESPWDRISPTIEAILRLQIRTSAGSEDGVITTRLLVPSSKVGCLLGQGGNVINEMRRRTRADIKVCTKEDKPSYISANEELVQISGNHDVAWEALLEIASRLRVRTFRSGNSSLNPAPMFPDHGFIPSERMSGRGSPCHRIGDPGYPPPVYSGHGFAPHESFPSRGPPSVGMTRDGSAGGYEYPKGPGPVYEAQGYPPGPAGPIYEAKGYTPSPAGPVYESKGYPPGPPPASTGYPNMGSTIEIKIPNSAVPSVLGVGGSNISEIRQISGARVKLHDPRPGSLECVVEMHGSSEQLKAAQSILQAFVASGGQSTPQPPMQPPMYRHY